MSVKIVVAGDVSVDWYSWPRPSYPNNEDTNWKLYEGISMYPQPGGAVLVAEMISNILQCEKKDSPYSVISQKCPNLVKKGPNEVLHTNVQLDLFPLPSPNDKEDIQVYRVKNNLGYTTPDHGIKYPDPLSIIRDEKNADFVIIHDAGNGFRSNEEKWPRVLKGNRKPIVIYNMYPPLFNGDLWNHVIQNHKENLILILNADDLRKIGANISRSISWEKSATEFLWEMSHNNTKLNEIKELTNVIVRFQFEGVIHYRGEQARSKLYFDPSSVEGSFWDDKKLGGMRAVTLIFVAVLSSSIIKQNKQESNFQNYIEDSVRQSLIKSREFLRYGYGNKHNLPEILEHTCVNIFKDEGRNYTPDQNNSAKNQSSKLPNDIIADTLLPSIKDINKYSNPEQSNSHFWTILKEKTKEESNRKSRKEGSPYLEQLAIDIVIKGLSVIKEFPVGRFGKLTTIDRAEIESFRSIKNIMEEYIRLEKIQKPLSIAVFGSPGSGKSFGIIQVAESIDREKIEKVTFNISQFTSTKHLTHAFHRVRDISLKGKIPLVFFDEFDSKFEDEELGWIKYFLVPMQDGKFMDYESMHPIGKSIFVFAGGTCSTFKEFCKFCDCYSSTKKSSDNKVSFCSGISNKCPDFLSRLRGYVNILGPNRIIDKDDGEYIIRRAILLRSLIEDYAPKIINSNGTADINESLLKALINVPEYIHGVRSMQAIVEMSMLNGKNSWQKAFLPPKDQLGLHIKNTKEFYRLLAQN